MIAAALREGDKPSLNEALEWIGSRVDDIYGSPIGRLEDVWIDPGTGEPRWLLVKEGRFGGRSTLVPFTDVAAGEDHVWVPYDRDVVREAPQVEPGAPLTQQVEATLRNHYAANATAAVSHGAQAARGQDPNTSPEPGAGATFRIAAEPQFERPPMTRPRMPERPAPPVSPRPREEAPERGYGYAPAPPAQPGPDPYRPQEQPHPHRPPAYRQPPPPPPAADPQEVLADLRAGQVVEIEISGKLTISGELRHIRIIPPERGRD